MKIMFMILLERTFTRHYFGIRDMAWNYLLGRAWYLFEVQGNMGQIPLPTRKT